MSYYYYCYSGGHSNPVSKLPGKDIVISTLLSTFNKEDFEFNDVRIVLEDGEISAIKALLAARSEYFKTMFNNSSNFKESQGVVKIKTTKKLMEKVVEYLYSGNISSNDLTLLEYLDLADLVRLMMLDEAFQFFEGSFDSHISCFKLSKPTSSTDQQTNISRELIDALELSLIKRLDGFAQVLANKLLSSISPSVKFVKKSVSEESLPVLLEKDHHYLTFNAFKYLMMCNADDVSMRLKIYNNWVELNGNFDFDENFNQLIRESFGEIWKSFKVEDMDEAIKHGLFNPLDVFNAVKVSFKKLSSDKVQLTKSVKSLKEEREKLKKEVEKLKDRLYEEMSDY